MANLNKVLLMGNLTRDPQLRYLPNQTAVVDVGIAVNNKYRTAQGEDREEVMFIDCTAFGKQAEVINQYMTKGKPIFIEGRLKLDTWDDKQSGQKRSKHKVTIDNFQFIGGRDGGSGGGGGNYEQHGRDEMDQRPSRPAPARQQRPAPAESPIGDEQSFKEDDIPF